MRPPGIPALDDAFRGAVYESFGAAPDVARELVSYGRSPYVPAVFATERSYPLADELFVGTWESYAAEASRDGAAACLKKRLVQLRFPIGAGMSNDARYLAATRRGDVPPLTNCDGLILREPARLEIILHSTPAGRIALIACGHRADFESLVRALTRRNEPDPIPPAVGACMVAGYNNWDRVARLRSEWAAERGTHDGDGAWRAAFEELSTRRELYQDRFIVLSAGPYSGVAGAMVGMTDAEWLRTSFIIRREHECAHYFTRRAFGAMRNTLVDELIADYAGIVAAVGRFRADWFLHFLGIDRTGGCRADGRIHNYRGTPALSDEAFAVLRAVVTRAADALEAIDASLPPAPRALSVQASVMTLLARVGLEALASGDAQALVRKTPARRSPRGCHV
jgi:hypothetical protein